MINQIFKKLTPIGWEYFGTLGEGGDGGGSTGLHLRRRVFQKRPEQPRRIQRLQSFQRLRIAGQIGHGHRSSRQETGMVAG